MASSASTKWHSQPVAIGLRFLALVSSLAALVAFAYSQNRHDLEAVLVSDLGFHAVTPATGTIEYAFIWALIIVSIELSTPFALHPGLYVAFDLIAWLGVAVGVFMYLGVMEPYYTRPYTCGRDYPDCNGKQVADVEHFATAMALLTLVINFGFFVVACRATDKLRKSQRVVKNETAGDNAA
ncbi:hypothetical protein BDW62DRAFT_185545 [Aspergillus aurantiobrunneus]